MKVLVINAGSSSLKFQLIDMENESVIAKGICDYYGVNTEDEIDRPSEKENNASSKDETLYSVQVGAFKNKKNAQTYIEKLKKSGFDGVIVKKN